MKKRFNLTWRVVTAMLLVLALVPALVVGVATAAPTPPTETTPPQLLSISWIDGGNGKIDWNDFLVFYWSESMLTSTLDTMGEINDYLDSTATGAPPTAWDYGSSVATPTWDATGTILTVQLGSDCSTELGGNSSGPAYVKPKSMVQDKAGNPVATTHPSIPIPTAPDTTSPTLLGTTWIDNDLNGLYTTGDDVVFFFSEAMSQASIIATLSYDAAFDPGGGKTYAAAAPGAPDFSLGNTRVTVNLAGAPTVVGNESITVANTVTDAKGNPIGNSSATLPKAADTTAPVLESITWLDGPGTGDNIINAGDKLVFKFSEAMDDSVINTGAPASVNTELTFGAVNGYGLPGDLTPLSVSWDLSYTELTVILGTSEQIIGAGAEAVNPSDLILDRSTNNKDGTAPAGITISTASRQAYTYVVPKENHRPVLNSVTWDDTAGVAGKIDGGDSLYCNFNESMEPSILDSLGKVNTNLDIPAIPGLFDYGTNAGGGNAMWVAGTGNTVLQIILGTDCTAQLSGQLVNPSNAVKDMAGNIDDTASPRIPYAPDEIQPKLLSISWLDGGAPGAPNPNGIIDGLDYLFFNFNEQMSNILTANVNAWLDSSAPGSADYGTVANGLASAWIPIIAGSQCQLQVTLGTDCSIVLGGQSVNPLVAVTDAKGNPDGTTGAGPAIPLPPDKTPPFLTSIIWQDIDSNAIMNRGDQLTFYFSEAMDPAKVDSASCPGVAPCVNTVLDTTAPGVADYGTAPELNVIWNVPAYTELTVILGTLENLDGGEMVNPTADLTDMAGNPDNTPGSGVQIPSVSGTPASLVRTPASLTFTAEVNGSNPANQSVYITNGGQQTLSWAVTNTKPWLTVTPTSGTNAGTLTCSVNISGLNVSTDTDTITIAATGLASQTVSVGLTITVPATPTPTATANASPTPTATANVTPTPTTTITPTPTATPGGSTGSGTVGTSGGTVATTDGKIEITFPDGAFDASTTVTITGGSCTHGDTDEFVVGSTCFSVTPTGALGAEATICVQLSSYDLSLGDEGDLTIGYWADGTWNVASDITITDDTICGKTSHLSDWAVLSSTGEGWVWWYWALIGGGAFIVVLAIILLIALPKRGKGEEIPAEELYGEEEEEF
jgi:hypothetical protein